MENYTVIGAGYLGAGVAVEMANAGLLVTATATSRSRVAALDGIGSYQKELNAGAENASYDFLQNQNGILISIGPSAKRSYEDVFEKGVDALVDALEKRIGTRDIHITFISSTGVYGDRKGQFVYEQSTCDYHDLSNRILSKAEQHVLSLENANTKVCILRLGGIYGPGRDIAGWLKQSAGMQVNMNGDHVCAWTSIDDAIRGVKFAYDKKLSGIYNLVDDTQYSRRDLGSLICDKEGLPPIIWNSEDIPGVRISNARVHNNKIKRAGFTLHSTSMFS